MGEKEYKEMRGLISILKDGHDVSSKCNIDIAMDKSPEERIAYCGAALEDACKAQILEDVLQIMDQVYEKYKGGQNG